MSFIRIVVFVVGIPLLFGCSAAPNYKTPEIPMPVAYKGDTSIWQPAQPAEEQPRGDWWRAYNDATLDDLVSRLDKANADLAVALAHFDQATAYAAQARASYFPSISAGAYATHNKQSANRPLRSSTQPTYYADNSASVSASYEVDLWGHVRNQVDAGEANVQAAAAEFESIHLSLRAELANDYLTLRMLDSQAKLMESEIEAYARALELTQNRYREGIDSGLDVARAKAQLETAKAKLADIKASRAIYEHAIATLVGEPASAFSIAPAVVDIQLPTIPVGIPSVLLQRRPDIAAAERRLAEANARIGVAKAAYFPAINLAAAGGYETSAPSGWLNAPNLFWSIGPNALLTIFDAGRRRAVVAQAEAAFNAAGAQYRSTVLHAFQEVEDNLSLLSNLSEESKALNQAVVDTRHALDIAMNRYREGVASYLEVVTAQTAAQQVQLEELNLRKRRLQASVNLIRALGGGWNQGHAHAPDGNG
jgi:NodT family efflux transporter outer membrane factor (OMF) lipoprotein